MRRHVPVAVSALAAALTASAAALAATPPANSCFGRCGGVPGVGPPLMPSLLVHDGRIDYLTFPSFCLGHYKVRVTNGAGTTLRVVTWPNLIEFDGIAGRTTIPISKTGAFSYTGRAVFVDGPGSSGKEHLTFTITGRFRTSTLAAGTVSIRYGSCRTSGFAIRRA